MADKKSLFDKYKIVGTDGNEKSAADYVPEVIGGETIEIPEEELPVVESLTGLPAQIKGAMENASTSNESKPTVFEAPKLEEKVFESEPVWEAHIPVKEELTVVEEAAEPEIEEVPEVVPEIHNREEEEFVFDAPAMPTVAEESVEEKFEFSNIKLPDNLFDDVIEEPTPQAVEPDESDLFEMPIAPSMEASVCEPVTEIPSLEQSGQEFNITFSPESDEKYISEAPIAPPVFVAPTEAPLKKKKEKQPKPPKAPKPPKEKKIKEPKPPKVKKEKSSKPDDGETLPPEPLTMKDHLTFILAIVALVLAIVFICVKYFPSNRGSDEPTTEPTTAVSGKLAGIQIQREGLLAQLVQSDIDNVFYAFSSTYELQYFQYQNGKMEPVKPTGTVTTEVDMGNETLPVTIDYVQVGDKVFGIGLFRGDQNPGVYFYNMVMFKLTNLPQGYGSAGKALLLAKPALTSNEQTEVLTQKNAVWTESFTIDLNSGKTTRFLSNVNRNIDPTTGAYVASFCVLTNNGYTSAASGKIPFLSGREYDANSGKRDWFIKNGNSESVFIKDVYSDYVLMDGNAVVYLKASGSTGFNVMRRENGQTSELFSFYGKLETGYLYENEYFLDKINGTLYNVKTGEEKALVGYRMTNPEMMSVSPDGRYLVVLGTVNSIMDYQIHIFDLETGDYAKYADENFSQHTNLSFIDSKTFIYTSLDPNRGFEYVILDAEKAFKK